MAVGDGEVIRAVAEIGAGHEGLGLVDHAALVGKVLQDCGRQHIVEGGECEQPDVQLEIVVQIVGQAFQGREIRIAEMRIKGIANGLGDGGCASLAPEKLGRQEGICISGSGLFQHGLEKFAGLLRTEIHRNRRDIRVIPR